MKFDNEKYTKEKYIDNHKGGYGTCNIIEKYLKGESLLDIGCGDGYLLNKTRYKFKFSMGLEMSKIATKLCLSKGLNVLSKKIEDFNTSQRFDSIVATDVLEHVEDINSVCRKVKSLLSENGVFVVVLPNPNSIKSLLKIVRNPRDDPAHVYCPTLKEAKNIFKSNGFIIKKINGIGKFKNIPRFSSGMVFILTKNDNFFLKCEKCGSNEKPDDELNCFKCGSERI